MSTSLGQFLRMCLVNFRIFCLKPACPWPKCAGARFSWTEFEQHCQTHLEDIRDPAGSWARQTGDEA